MNGKELVGRVTCSSSSNGVQWSNTWLVYTKTKRVWVKVAFFAQNGPEVFHSNQNFFSGIAGEHFHKIYFDPLSGCGHTLVTEIIHKTQQLFH